MTTRPTDDDLAQWKRDAQEYVDDIDARPSVRGASKRTLAAIAEVEALRAEMRVFRYHYIEREDRHHLCPTCTGSAHRDLAGIYWATDRDEAVHQVDELRGDLEDVQSRLLNTEAERDAALVHIEKVEGVLTRHEAAFGEDCNIPARRIPRALDSAGDGGEEGV